MPEREHTNRNAIDELYSSLPAPARPRRSWLRAVWRWIKEELFAPFEPVEPLGPYGRHALIPRRIRIHKRAVKLAKYMRWYDQDEAREIYAVVGMLLGFEAPVRTARRAQEARRA